MDTKTLAQAVAHHQAGRLGEAERGYRAVLVADPNHADALHLLGVLSLQSGRLAEAVTLIGQALERSNGVADYWDNLGTALAADGRAAEAAQAHRNAVLLDPQGAQRRHNLGNALAALGRHEEAEGAFAVALALRPDYAKAWYNLGNSRSAHRRHDAAAAALAHAMRLAPDMVEAHNNLGDALAMAGRLDEAIAQHRIVTTLRPDDATAHYNLGAVLQQRGAYESAEIAYRQALKRNPRHTASLNNLGSVLKRLGRPDQAEQCHRQALELHPDFVEARYNLGNALQAQARYDEAAACYEEALAQQPDLATASFNLSLLALLHGDLARGWTGYERRFAAGEVMPDRRIAAPRWTGELLRGRRLLVWREQGVGDEILFASCYPDVIAWGGGPVVIECDPRLVPLFRRSFPRATVRAESCTGDAFRTIPRETIDPPDVDLQVPAGDLPHRLRDSLSAFEPQGPWLVPDPALVARWRERLAALGPGLKVGIGWRSQLITQERIGAYTRLDQWGPVFAVPGITFVNLQYGECEAELAAAERRFGVTIHRWSDLNLKDDFDNAAALTANL
ncbi:tetratricopeptide repeat protein, partial [Azospirillum sp. TSO35-2]|uniref:tetratricopeptide repeat protein n=1 Tax=Azospirillum sp. TSO35-2 TaxID=716796 RepID=UPI0011B63B98